MEGSAGGGGVRWTAANVPSSEGGPPVHHPVYAPTFLRSDEERDEFYEGLKKLLKEAKKRGDEVILLGDFKARVGRRDEIWGEEVLEPHGLPERNENGTRLLEFCIAHRCRVMGTSYRHRTYGTWMHTGTRRWHIVDHVVCITYSRNSRSSLSFVISRLKQ